MTATLLLLLLAQRGIPGRSDEAEELRPDRMLHFAAGRRDIPQGLGFRGGAISIDDEFGTRARAFNLPFRHVPGEDGDDPAPAGTARPVFEGGGGYSRASGRTADLFQGQLPGQELGVDIDWTYTGGEAGGGVQFDLGDGFRITPVLLVGLAEIENDADYSGPGAPTRGPPLNGTVFNWDATVLSWGASVRAESRWRLGPDLFLTSVFRYDGRAYETLHSTTSAQEEVDPAHLFGLDNVLAGRFDFRVFGRPLAWRAILNYRRAAGNAAETLGFADYVEVGGLFDLGLNDLTYFPGTVSLGGTAIWGPDVHGWTLSLDLSF